VSLVEASVEGRVALVRLNRPEKLNALSAALEEELDDVLAGPRVRGAGAVVVAGSERAFSAGADLAELRDATAASALHYYAGTGGLYERLAALPQPTLAAIRGWCLGGGLELALACDFRIAEPGAALGFPEVEHGILPSSGGTVRLVRAVGVARAKELVLLRRRFSASEALAAGLVTEVVPDAEARALAAAAELAELPATAVAVVKRSIEAIADGSRAAGVLIEQLAYAALADQPATVSRPGS
jgi:enoyl-CoA hydratase/carnithine racemase